MQSTADPSLVTAVGHPATGDPVSSPSWTVPWPVRLLWAWVLLTGLLPGDWNFTPSDEITDFSDGGVVPRLQLVVTMAWAGALALRNRARLWTPDWLVMVALLLSLSWAGLSVAWSAMPDESFKGWVRLCVAALAATVMAQGYQGRFTVFLSDGLVVLMCVLVPSVLVSVLVPSLGRETVAGIEGSWRGITTQKNTLGMASALAATWFVVLWLVQPRLAWKRAWMWAVAVVCLLGSRSSTALLMHGLMSGVFWLFYRQHMRSFAWLLRLGLLAVLVVGAYLFVFFLWHSQLPTWNDFAGSVAEFFGKSADMTGRADIWLLMWPEIDKHPWQGVGYTAFWRGPGSPSQFFIDILYWYPGSSHNGFLDLINELGFVGLGLFGLLCAAHLMRIATLLGTHRPEAAAHLAFLVPFLAWNFSESSAFSPYSVLNLVALCSLLMASRLYYKG